MDGAQGCELVKEGPELDGVFVVQFVWPFVPQIFQFYFIETDACFCRECATKGKGYKGFLPEGSFHFVLPDFVLLLQVQLQPLNDLFQQFLGFRDMLDGEGTDAVLFLVGICKVPRYLAGRLKCRGCED